MNNTIGDSEANDLQSKSLTGAEMNSRIEKHLAIWNEKNTAKRLKWMKNVYAPNIEIVDRHLVAVDCEKINTFINMLQ